MTKKELINKINENDMKAFKELNTHNYMQYKQCLVRNLKKNKIGYNEISDRFWKLNSLNKEQLEKYEYISSTILNKIYNMLKANN